MKTSQKQLSSLSTLQKFTGYNDGIAINGRGGTKLFEIAYRAGSTTNALVDDAFLNVFIILCLFVPNRGKADKYIDELFFSTTKKKNKIFLCNENRTPEKNTRV